MAHVTKVAPSGDVVDTALDNGDVVLLNLTTRKYYSLSETGAKVWALLAEGTDAEAIAAALCEEYEVTSEDAARSVEELLSDLRAHGLVEDRAEPA